MVVKQHKHILVTWYFPLSDTTLLTTSMFSYRIQKPSQDKFMDRIIRTFNSFIGSYSYKDVGVMLIIYGE